MKSMLLTVCSGENRKSQILFILDGILINAALVLTQGVFLSGYIVYLKGSDFLVGILNSSSGWASIIAIISFFIYERMVHRKRLLLYLNIISRLLVCSIIFLPLLSKEGSFILSAAASMVIVGNLLWGFYSIGSTVWMMSLLTHENRSWYINTRMLLLRISFTSATIIMGFVLDWFNKSYTGFLLVFSASLVFSIFDFITLAKAKEPPSPVERDRKPDLGLFFKPMQNKRYRNFLIFTLFFYLSLAMSSSFTPLYLIRYLKFDYGFISVIYVITYVMMVLCTKLWGKLESRKGLVFVLRISSVFIIAEPLIYSFVRNETYLLLLLAPVVSGIGNSGFNIAIFTYRYEIMPELGRTVYEGWFGALYGLGMLLAPILGDFLMKRLPVIHNAIYQYSSFQLLYLISFILAAFVIFLMFYRPGRANANPGTGLNTCEDS